MSRDFQKARRVNIPLQKARVMVSFEESGKGGAADGREMQGTPGCAQRRESRSLRFSNVDGCKACWLEWINRL